MRVLIVRIGAMGDVLHALPAVAALRAAHPNWFIGWAIDPRWNDLLQIAGDPNDLSQIEGRHDRPALIDRWYRISAGAWRRKPLARTTRTEIAALRHLLKSERFDICVDLQGGLKSAAVGWVANAKVFVGPEHPREKPARRLYGIKVPVEAPHVVQQACEILGAAIGEPLNPAPVRLPIDEVDERSADEILGHNPFCLIAPTAGWGAKVWPSERYGAVAAHLGRAGWPVLVNASSSSDEAAQQVVRASEGFARAVPSSLGQMIAIARRASLVIAGDTGPLHLAAALERPVVGIYGPTSPVRNGPWATTSRVLRDSESITSHKRLSDPEPGMLRISVEDVVRAAFELLPPSYVSLTPWR